MMEKKVCLTILCDCSHASMKNGRDVALDQIFDNILTAARQITNISLLNLVLVDTESLSDDVLVYMNQEYEINDDSIASPSYYGLMKGNCPIGEAIRIFSEDMGAHNNLTDIVILLASSSGTGSITIENAVKLADRNIDKFRNARRIVIGINVRSQTLEELSFFSSPDENGNPYVYNSYDMIDFDDILKV